VLAPGAAKRNPGDGETGDPQNPFLDFSIVFPHSFSLPAPKARGGGRRKGHMDGVPLLPCTRVDTRASTMPPLRGSVRNLPERPKGVAQ
jgi:hypothetical protein